MRSHLKSSVSESFRTLEKAELAAFLGFRSSG
jgi:hypothetical protein